MSAAQRAPEKAASAVLVGDIGGTRTRLAIHGPTGHKPLAEMVLPSQEYVSFDEALERFLGASSAPYPSLCVLAVAAPIRDRAAAFTNLPWVIEEHALSRRFGFRRALLVNDLVAAAQGCLAVRPASLDLLTERAPVRRGQNLAVIAAGTGLGEARLIWTGNGHLALPTEGGHRDFAPRNVLEIELLRFLLDRFPEHVSVERVLSGSGLGLLYDFFAARSEPEPPEVAARLGQGDRNEAIASLGLSAGSRPAAQAVDLFASIYGAEAGNLALGELALGGVMITGSIANQIVRARRALFLGAFQAKGRFGSLLAAIPVAVVADPFVNRRGALAIARALGQGKAPGVYNSSGQSRPG
ncbi:MAG: glucokinase [Byssovorax sp.]